MIRLLARLFPILFLVTTLFTAQPSTTHAQPSGQPLIVATHSVIGDIVRNVGGDRINLVTLVGPNGEIHAYEPVPADIRTIGQATIIFENGFGLETWLPGVYNSSGSVASRVPVTANIRPIIAFDGPEAGEPDPHFWFDVANVISAVEVVRDSLSQVDPTNESYYHANASSYIGQLQELDAWIFDQVRAVPSTRRTLVTTHDTFGYLARRYGFQIVGNALSSLSNEAQPSAQRIAALISEIRSAQVRVIFPETVTNPALMERIARDAGVTLGPPLYTDSLGDPNGPAGTYIGMMRYNVSTIMDSFSR